MGFATFSVRMDEDVKEQFEDFCTKVGMNTTTAFNMFARAVIRERRLPFEVAVDPDPFYSEENQAYLKQAFADLEAGRNWHYHDLIEVSDSE